MIVYSDTNSMSLLSLSTTHVELWLVLPSIVYALMGSPFAAPSLQWMVPDVAVTSSARTAPGAPGGPAKHNVAYNIEVLYDNM